MPTHNKRNHVGKSTSNTRTLFVGPFFSSKTHLQMTKTEDIAERVCYITTISLGQYDDFGSINEIYTMLN